MNPNNKAVQMKKIESVADFYAGQSVFVTGGAGFLGKVLIEKLLYSCNGLRHIYMLVRDKRGTKAEERIQQLINKELFSRLKDERPQDLNKIIPIVGDLTQPDLGLSHADKKLLVENVSIVFHLAAMIKFNESLKLAVDSNVEGTRKLLNLCHEIKTIKAFIYVSTAYSSTKERIIQEKIYQPHISLNELLKILKQANYCEKDLLNGLPNTYTMSKNLAENLILNHRGTIPTAIVRPSIVSPSFREPLSGWTDSWFGATSISIFTTKGLNRVLYGDRNNILDIIPVDYVTNTIIVAATECSRLDEVRIYNSSTSSCNPISIENFNTNFMEASICAGFSGNLSLPLIYTRSKLICYIFTFFLHILPSYIADLYLFIMRRKPKYRNLQSKIKTTRDAISFVTMNSWEIKANNVKSLHNSLSYSDSKIFPCNAADINWTEYITVYVHGVMTYLMKNVDMV